MSDGGDGTLLDRLDDALRWYRASGHVSPDPTTGTGAIRLLEAEMRRRLRTAACFAVASCTSALTVAMQAAGVGVGDEVLIPADQWGASRAVVELLGATPVVVPLRPGRNVIDQQDVLDRLSEHSVAVVVTHYPGQDAPAHDLVGPLADRGITLIEDAAAADAEQLLGPDPVGSVGRFGCFSYGPGKTIDAGGGGLIAVRDDHDLVPVLRLSQHPARQSLSRLPDPSGGLNHRIHPVAAVLALHSLAASSDLERTAPAVWSEQRGEVSCQS